MNSILPPRAPSRGTANTAGPSPMFSPTSSSMGSLPGTSASGGGLNASSSSTAPAGHTPRPSAMERMPSTSSAFASTSASMPGTPLIMDANNGTSFPMPAESVLNRKAGASASLYQNCRAVLEDLHRVPGFEEAFITPTLAAHSSASSGDDGAAAAALSTDPVSRSLLTLRLGSSLCFLFNALDCGHVLEVSPQATMANFKACQRSTAHFIMACKQYLHWQDSDLFAIHELYGQDTNGVVKVINTVKKVLAKLDEQGVLQPPNEEDAQDHLPSGPMDDRTKVVREILESERKYVQDLEVLQDYQRALAANDVLTQDQIHQIFFNLNALADFQRRFLIGVEANTSQPVEQQRFGYLFLQMEDHFSVYEAYCANLTAAQELAQAEVQALMRLANVLEPQYELPQMLIKPVQRICKYPLLIKELLKHSASNSPFYRELEDGYASILRVTDKVNETKRKEDNRNAVLDLCRRVVDWKGHDINSFGELLLHEIFVIQKGETDREYHVYLFERIILCCTEAGGPGSKKPSKSNSILKKPPSKRPFALQLKGRIFVNNVIGVTPIVRNNNQWLLEVGWRGDTAEESFTIRCRTEELFKQWHATIWRATEECSARSDRRRVGQLAASARSRGLQSPYSQFPGTPMSESAPSMVATPSDGMSPYVGGVHAGAFPSHHANGSQHWTTDDEGGADDERPPSGRSTPSLAARLRALPLGSNSDNDVPPPPPPAQRTSGRSESKSSVIQNWRSQTGATPSTAGMARGTFMTSTMSDGVYPQSLRSSASSRQLRSKASSEWGSPTVPLPQNGRVGSHPLPPPPASASHFLNGMGDNRSAESEARWSDTTPRGPASTDGPARHSPDGSTPRPSVGVYRQASQVATSTQPQAPALRNRSQSSPHVYQLDSSSQRGWNAGGREQEHLDDRAADGFNKHGPTHSGGTYTSVSSSSDPKRFSSSTNDGTDRSSSDRSSQQSHGHTHTAATSPATTMPHLPSSARMPPLHQRNGSHGYLAATSAPGSPAAVKVKVNYGPDTFVIAALTTITYPELVSKVVHKLRNCADRTKIDKSTIRLRYADEDGDRILMNSQEDLSMAMSDVVRGMSSALVLFAS